PAAAPPETGMRLVGAHTDSPNLRLRPDPANVSLGYRQLTVEVYGGALTNSWLDRDLGVSGRVVVAQGSGREIRLVRIDRPLLRIPQLAPHLDHTGLENGVKLNPQTQLIPIWGLESSDSLSLAELLGTALDVPADQILSWDLMAHDLLPGTLSGASGEFISAARLDNLGSAYAATRALVQHREAPGAGHTAVICLFDHEEVGSQSSSGAGGALLASVLERVVAARGGGRTEFLRALAGSQGVSADMAHAVHPNYPERYEPGHMLHLNGGPAIKINANQRYATDAIGAADFAAACELAGVPVQRYVSRGDVPCGSTIGPIVAARLGVDTVDVGMAQLAMHSARELAGAEDPALMVRALTTFFGT
ncbi:MAG: M18 family aminopeptidase, partial [Candidatus Dormibacteria bacterium]